jgi:hypothetical protein
MTRPKDQYEWWPQPKALEMWGRLQASLEKVGPEGRLCARPKKDMPGVTEFWVQDAAGNQVGALENDSFLCPPIC